MSINSHKHQTFKPYVPKVYGNHSCQKVSLIHGELHVCGEPTEGKTYCPQCERRLITLTDRVPPIATAEEKHSWRKPMKL
jgi:hypothetical protein